MAKFLYYIPVETEEHFLFASEWAEIFKNNYNVCTEKGEAPYKLILSWFKKCEDEDEDIKAPLLYKTKYGMSRVYPNGQKYLYKLINKYPQIKKDNNISINFGNSEYKLRRYSMAS